MALFATPEQVQRAEFLQRQQQGPAGVFAGGMYNLGYSGGNLLRRAMGDDTRSQAVRDAREIQNYTSWLDVQNPQSVYDVANNLIEAGYVNEAQQVLSLLPRPGAKTAVGEPYIQQVVDPNDETRYVTQYVQRMSDGSVEPVGASLGAAPKETTKAKPIGAPYIDRIQDPNDPGNYVYQRVQGYDDGSVKSIGAALQNPPKGSDKAVPSGVPYQRTIQDPKNPGNWVTQWFQDYDDGSSKSIGTALQDEPAKEDKFGLSDSLYAPIEIEGKRAARLSDKLSNHPDFKSIIDSTGDQDLEPFLGAIQSVAQRRKTEVLNEIFKQVSSPDSGVRRSEWDSVSRLLYQQAGGDESVINEAYDLWVAQGGFNASTDPSVLYGGAEAALPTFTDEADLPTLQRQRAQQAEIAKARQAAEGRLGISAAGPYEPTTKEVRMAAFTAGDVRPVFTNLSEFSNEDIEAGLIGKMPELQMSAPARDWHYSNWDLMREQQPAVNEWFVADGLSGEYRNRRRDEWKKRLLDEGDVVEWVYSDYIFRYLDRMKGKLTAGPQSPHNIP